MTAPSTREILLRLGRGERIADVCAAAGWSRSQFDGWWREECRRRVPAMEGTRKVGGVQGAVRIARDRWGIPHIQAATDADLFFGFGYATVQDRLFQLDWLRRKARGRLSEILGSEGVESDILFRTLGLGHVAEREWENTPRETRELLAAYTAGINALIEESGDCLPIEFDLLDYRPEPWRPSDSLAIIGEFRWYLTVRFPVIVIPELAKRTLGEGPLYQAFLQGELDEESILQRGEYPPGPPLAKGGLSKGSRSGDEGPGSNNWVLAGKRSSSGQPIVSSDPHIPFGAVSIWQQVRLDGGSFQVAGVALAGMPAVMIGRNHHVAWGITNNICSLRDLYQERADSAHPDCFLYDGKWEKAKSREEVIQVRGAAPVRKTIRSSRNGPIVDEILPGPARQTGPVSLRWLGFEPCGWLTALIGMNRASSCAEFREATRPWLCPTFNIVHADDQGHMGFQSVGRIPIRNLPERGFRPGWDPRHQWDGLIPFEGMPHLEDPERGYILTANHRVAPDDYPYPLSGTWSMAYRARRIREQIEGRPQMSPQDCQTLQQDVHSGRAALLAPKLVAALAGDDDPRVRQAVQLLKEWDAGAEATSVAAALFNVFYIHWCLAVCRERFGKESAGFVAANAGGLAAELLEGDKAGWFVSQERVQAIRAAFRAALEELTQRLGPDIAGWTWGRLHYLVQKHFLSARGDLGQLLDRSGIPARGDGTTVCSSTPDANHAAWLGAGFRMVADLADPKRGMWAVEVGSSSGHPGSPHYDDQIGMWSEGGYHYAGLVGGEEGKELRLEGESS